MRKIQDPSNPTDVMIRRDLVGQIDGHRVKAAHRLQINYATIEGHANGRFRNVQPVFARALEAQGVDVDAYRMEYANWLSRKLVETDTTPAVR